MNTKSFVNLHQDFRFSPKKLGIIKNVCKALKSSGITFSKILTENHNLWLKTKKRVEYIWVLENIIDDESKKDKWSWIWVRFLVINSLSSKHAKFNCSNQPFHVYAVCWHKQPPDNKTIQLQFWKLRSTPTFLEPTLGDDQSFCYFLSFFFFQQERVFWCWLAGTSLKYSSIPKNLGG